MVPIKKKRPRIDSSQKSRKRQRADNNSTQPITKTTALALDVLPWTEVPLPDRFEDAEGFFGLEEIDDVEVLRDPILGKLEYRVGKGFNHCSVRYNYLSV